MYERYIPHHPVLLLGAILSILASCGGKDAVAPVDVEKQAFEDLRTEVREVIDDPTREAEVLTLVDALSAELNTLRKRISERNTRVRQLNANYDASRADFEALFDRIYVEIRSDQQRVTETHRTLLATTTPEEWALISKARTKAMYAAISTIQVD
jgi:hypothetical protein